LVGDSASFALGEQLDVYFELPNRVAIEARAEVVRHMGGSLALRFSEIDATAQLALRSYCRLALIRNRPGAPRAFAPVTHPNRV
jgi:hypothetical protein